VKTTEVSGERGYDAGKKIKGRKRHLLVDTMGLVMLAVVHGAHIQDRDGAKLVFDKAKEPRKNNLVKLILPICTDFGSSAAWMQLLSKELGESSKPLLWLWTNACGAHGQLRKP